MASSDSHISALVKLLSDDHAAVVEPVRRKLIDLGAEALPFLEEAARGDPDPKVRVGARSLLESIRLASLRKECRRPPVFQTSSSTWKKEVSFYLGFLIRIWI